MAMHMPDHAGTEPQQKRAPKGALSQFAQALLAPP